MYGLFAVLCGALAWSLEVEIQASVDPTSGRITGVLRSSEPIELRNALSELPMPTSDLVRPRTFPGEVDAGWMDWVPVEGEALAWSFETQLPQRFGALGFQEDRGIWANGGWYPQPVLKSSQMPVVDWGVEVQVPPTMTGVLNDVVGQDSIEWQGRSRRVGLAVLLEGRTRVVHQEGLELVLVEDGRSRPEREAELERIAEQVWTLEQSARVVFVEAPMLRRLVRAGPGVVFLSDHAFRLSQPLVYLHREAIARSVLEASLPLEDSWHRSIAAVPLGREAAGLLREQDSLKGLAGVRLPQAHTLFYDGRTPFLSDVFGEVHSSDPLADDLEEILRERVPGRVVARWLDALGGEGAALGVAEGLKRGLGLAESMEAQGLDSGLALAWAAPMPEQDLALEMRGGGRPRLALERRVEGPAAPVPVVVEVDDAREVWLTGEGSDEWTMEYDERVRKVVVDPERLILQPDRSNDRWPRGVWVVPAGYLSAIHLTERRFEGTAWMTIRRPYNTHRLAQVVLTHNAESTASFEGLVGRYLGPYRDRMRRQHLVWGSVAAGILEPEFRPTNTGRYHTDVGLGYSWDTRVSPYFPERGHRLWVRARGGAVPASDANWARVQTGLSGVRMFRPGHAVAGRIALGVAAGNVPHKLLPIGGSGGLSSVPSNAALGNISTTVGSEYRVVLLDGLSVRLPFYWLSQVQLIGGVEAGWLGQEGGSDPMQQRLGVGATLGVNVIADVMGMRPVMGGVALGRLLLQDPIFLEPDEIPPVMVMLRLGHSY
ncbi:MAG: hypothetical protein VX519_06095 [Myxococcota bacterium]|nr:hypothetical protein [Myxococcota bacterium]